MAKAKTIQTQIIQAALKCFEKTPVASVTLMEIAKKAQISRPLVRYYYNDSDAVFFDVIQLILEDLRAHTQKAIEKGGKDLIQVLENYSKVTFHWGKEKPQYMKLWLYFYHLSSFSPPFQELNSEIRRVGRERIENLLYRGVATQIFPKEAASDIGALSFQIQGVVTGNTILTFTESNDSGFGPLQAAEITFKEIRKLLGLTDPWGV